MDTKNRNRSISPFTINLRVGELKELAAKGELTESHLRHIWEGDRECPYYIDSIRPEAAPLDLTNDLHHSVIADHVTTPALRRWSVRYRIALPRVVEWIKHNWEIFTKLPMDHVAFLREIFADETYGERLRWEIAEWPFLLTLFPEDERWTLLEAALQTHGHTVSWAWPARVMHWSTDKTIDLVRRLIQNPEFAGAFLANESAHEGWIVFQEVNLFLEIVREAAGHAPYEAQLNRRWLATKVGDLKTGRNFMETEPGWPNMPDRYMDELNPMGEQEIQSLLVSVMDELATATSGRSLSSASLELAKRIRALPNPITNLGQLKAFGTVLIDLPSDCRISRALLTRVLAAKGSYRTSGIELGYRWLVSSECRWSRQRHLIYREDGSAEMRDDYQREYLMKSWFAQAFRAELERQGWLFRPVEKRRNERFQERSDRGYDYQIVVDQNRERRVYKLPRPGSWGQRHDTYHEGDLVMVPPNFSGGRQVHQSGRVKIFVIDNEDLHPAKPVTSDMEKWSQYYV